MFKIFPAAGAVVALGLAGAAQANEIVWALENAGSNGGLWQLDVTADTATRISSNIKDPVDSSVGGGWSTVAETPDGTLYFLRRFQNDINVYSVPSTSIVVSGGTITNLTSLGATGLGGNLDGLTAGPDGKLYLTAYDQSVAGSARNGLFRFDPITKTTSFVGTFAGDAGPGGVNSFYTDLSFDPLTGDLIGTGTDSSGQFIPWRLKGSQVIGQVNQTFSYVDAFSGWNGLADGLAFNRITGDLYASSDTGGVYQIDRNTGAILRNVASTAGSSIGTDLAVQADTIPNPVPEPASLGLLGIGLAGLGLLRRRKEA